MSDSPRTLVEAVKHVADLDACHEYMIGVRWPDGKITCPRCGADKIGCINSRRLLQCKSPTCRKQFNAKAGTIFEGSPLPLSSWFVAVWCIANAKNGISSYELARTLGVTQTSAWFMLHRIRMAMATGGFVQASGVVESDELVPNRRSRNHGVGMKSKKPSGGAAFDVLLGELAQVPKADADRRARQWKRERAKRKESRSRKPQ